MERSLCQRRAKIEMHRAVETCNPNHQELSVIQSIFEKNGDVFGASIIFQYGVMQGKRQERAKRKRRLVTT